MEYCQYHPLAPGTHYCPSCAITSCDTCTDGEDIDSPRCFICNGNVEMLGASNTAEPFWRRLQQSFRYPLSIPALMIIVGVALANTVLGYIPSVFVVIFYLILSGAIIKYAFSCLESTAKGEFKAPKLAESYGDGVVLLILFYLLFLIVGVVVALTYSFIGVGVGTIVGIIAAIFLPAMVINFSLNHRLLEALNPLNALRLILAVGPSYVLLLIFMAIMFFSVAILNALLGNEYSFLLVTVQSVISNYYTIVIFHIMGYMLFQYQGNLGFIARDVNAVNALVKTEQELLDAKISVYLKNGKYNEVLTVFSHALRQYPEDKIWYSRCFDFLCATKDQQHMSEFASTYLEFLQRSRQGYLMRPSYQRIIAIKPDYMPENPAIRLGLAATCYDSGDFKTAVTLLNGLHKAHPMFSQLAEAYQLMSKCLDNLPNMQNQSKQSLRLAEHFINNPPPVASPDKPTLSVI